MKYVFSAIISIAMLAGAVWFLADPSQCGSKLAASSFAKSAVLDTLKSPSSADFSNMQAHADGECAYMVAGRVTAENGFGGDVKNTFSAVVDFTNGGNNYAVRDILIAN